MPSRKPQPKPETSPTILDSIEISSMDQRKRTRSKASPSPSPSHMNFPRLTHPRNQGPILWWPEDEATEKVWPLEEFESDPIYVDEVVTCSGIPTRRVSDYVISPDSVRNNGGTYESAPTAAERVTSTKLETGVPRGDRAPELQRKGSSPAIKESMRIRESPLSSPQPGDRRKHDTTRDIESHEFPDPKCGNQALLRSREEHVNKAKTIRPRKGQVPGTDDESEDDES